MRGWQNERPLAAKGLPFRMKKCLLVAKGWQEPSLLVQLPGRRAVAVPHEAHHEQVAQGAEQNKSADDEGAHRQVENRNGGERN